VKACVLTAAGGLEHIVVTDVPDPPAPGPGEVRVALQAAALNHLDLHVVAGLPGLTYRFPHILGADGAGVVAALGPGVDALRVGDRVLINPGVSCYQCEFCLASEHSLCVRYGILGEHHPGTLAQFIVLPQHNLARVPDVTPQISWPEAAAFSLVTLTAWRMVVTRARVQAGETVLIWGIGGGVALAALRVAKLRGARAIVTSSSDAKLEAARRLGADLTINHRRQDVGAEVRVLTKRRGVDVVVENVGDATWQTSLRCLAKGGRLVTCGATTGPLVETDVRRLFWNQYTIMGSTMGNAAEYRDVVGQLAAGQLRPIVDRVFPIAEARAALERLQRGEQLGKIAITIA
jgi:NADPH:quinone reductase-like Zn-dependent oxidoreductase